MFEIIETGYREIQYRFPKSKKRRIRKKWSKRSSNYRVDDSILVAGNTMYCNPRVAYQLRFEADRIAADMAKEFRGQFFSGNNSAATPLHSKPIISVDPVWGPRFNRGACGFVMV
jgi:hypothetical protein